MDYTCISTYKVSALGFGCSGLSEAYGTYSSEDDTIALFHHAFNRGITFLDTAEMYGHFANEILVGKVFSLVM
jgi:aryl-alcohol dehydrogenase-like predicted oxidoreductase